MRALFTLRWLGIVMVALVAAVVMVQLGRWQWSRYELRSEINSQITASTIADPLPFAGDLPQWTRVTLTGRFDVAQEILIRNRTVAGKVGYEVLTPLVLADGSAVLINRGWVPPHEQGMSMAPEVPAPPGDNVTVIGRVRNSEPAAGTVEQRHDHWQARRIHLPALTEVLPYPAAGSYVQADESAAGFTPIPVARQKDWLNLGYAVQWWLFAAGVFIWLGWLARKEITSPGGDLAQQERLG